MVEPSQMDASPRTTVVVLGMHRSGTSACAGALHRLGIAFGHDLLGPRPDNPKGYFEHRKIVERDDHILGLLGRSFDDLRPIDWAGVPRDMFAAERHELSSLLRCEFGHTPTFGIKDPRICRLLPIWIDAIESIQHVPKFLIVFRSPFEVASSLQARNGFAPTKSLMLWLLYNLEALQGSRGYERCML